MRTDNFDIYTYYKGETIAPNNYVSSIKAAYWNCESWWHLNKHNEREQSLEEYVKRYCIAIADKWMYGSGYTGEDIYNDYLQPDTDLLKN